MKDQIKNFLIGCFGTVAIVFIAVMAIVTTKDAINFHESLNVAYKTPWYDSNPLKQPYTALRVYLADKGSTTEQWKSNAIGSERWHVRETKFGDTYFWTTLERIDISEK